MTGLTGRAGGTEPPSAQTWIGLLTQPAGSHPGGPRQHSGASLRRRETQADRRGSCSRFCLPCGRSNGRPERSLSPRPDRRIQAAGCRTRLATEQFPPTRALRRISLRLTQSLSLAKDLEPFDALAHLQPAAGLEQASSASASKGYPARIRTWTKWTKTTCATITPRGKQAGVNAKPIL